MELLKVCLVVSVVGLCGGLEVPIPERFLRPRDFNPHPYPEEVESAGTLTTLDLDQLPHPYALFRRPPVHRGESSTAPIQFPKVPDGPQEPAPRLKSPGLQSTGVPPPSPQPQRVHVLRPATIRNAVGKNYAFSYAVRDRGSGDDFSHEQAHKAGATKGEYRVRLPDGRLQIVSYTADNSGYRADVRYDDDNSVESGYQQPQGPSPVSVKTYVPQIKTYSSDLKSYVPDIKSYTADLKTYVPDVKTYSESGLKSYAGLKTYGEEAYDDYLQSLDYEDGRGKVRYLVQAAPGRAAPEYTPIHEDYPDVPPPDRDHAPTADPSRQLLPSPSPTPAYISPKPSALLLAIPSPSPAYISPKPSALLLAIPSPSPAPHNLLVLSHQVKPYQY